MRVIHLNLILIFLFLANSCDGTQSNHKAETSKESEEMKDSEKKTLDLNDPGIQALINRARSMSEEEYQKVMIRSSWIPFKGNIVELMTAVGGMEAVKNFAPSPKAHYPWDQIHKKISDYQQMYGYVDKEGKMTGKKIEDASATEKAAYDELLKEIEPWVSREKKFEGSEVFNQLTACGLETVNLEEIPLTEEMRNSELYKKLKLKWVYVFHDWRKRNFTVLNINEEGLRWETFGLNEYKYDEDKVGETTKVVVERPQSEFFNYLSLMVEEKKCPNEFLE